MFCVRSVDNVQLDPSVISELLKPPFMQLPDPTRAFIKRAEGLRALAEGHNHADAQSELRAPEMLAAASVARAKERGMSPLDRSGFSYTALKWLLPAAANVKMPEVTRRAFNSFLLGY
jgi:hypothetical protein